MVLNITTQDGLDVAFATFGDDVIIMADLPPDQLDRLQSSPLTDAVYLVDGNNYFENNDVGRIVFGGPGDDTIIGGAGDDSLIGGAGDNVIFGGAGNDTLTGGPGNDVLSGGEGIDTLTGGGGSNRFILPDAPQNRDVITDFTTGSDKILLPDGVSFADIQVQNISDGALILRDGAALSIVLESEIRLEPDDFLTREDVANAEQLIAESEQALLQNPQNALAHNQRGEALYRLGRQDDAIRAFTIALTIDPARDSIYYTNRGRAHLAIRDELNAIGDFTQAIRSNPRNVQAFFGRGVVYSVAEEFDLAIRDYTQAIRLEPGIFASYYNRGLAHFQLEQYGEAIADFTRAIALNPDDVLQYFARGVAQEEAGNAPAAVPDYQRVIELDPNFADAHYRLGIAHRRFFNLRASRDSFEEAARLYEIQGNEEGLSNVAQERGRRGGLI
ncbi:tetratricopeptide repeat protein [Phormidium yuhuli AB48]|uniref:Tetratricopeptide repeat protein n=1 Tax=Phormidium yuhuli AB48 TaxID=2940671 RepID=A0ABY5AU69_9CYAN|nr:tetratricopeptide repeat protein [Phormidium yuhuli]USR92378.1 tetratricopeptide repeat protein [Phormidium yuhuli AB48]